MSDESRSRTAWPPPATTAVPDYADLYQRKRRVHLLLSIAILVLALAVGTLTYFVYQQQQFIEGKGEQRDRENARLEERIRRSTCDLLDTLPEGGLLERPRAKYGCGPGIPRNLLTPDEQARLGIRPPTVPPEEPAVSPSTPAPFSGGAVGPSAPSTDTYRPN